MRVLLLIHRRVHTFQVFVQEEPAMLLSCMALARPGWSVFREADQETDRSHRRLLGESGDLEA